MLEYVLNAGIIAIFLMLVVWLSGQIRKLDRGASLPLTKRQSVLVLLGLVALLIKFITLADPVLITGQAITVLLCIVLVWWAYAPPVPRKTSTAEVVADVPTKPKKQPKKQIVVPQTTTLPKPLIAFVVIIAIAMGVIVGLMHVFSGTSQGTLSSSEPSGTTVPTPKQLTLTGVHFTLVYPNNFNQATIDAPHAPILENYNFAKPDTPSWRLAIQVESLPSGNINDDGSYHSRAVNPGRFTITPTAVNGFTMYIATDNASDSAFAKAAYFVHDGLLGSVALTGGGSQTVSQMQSLYMAILQSWEWR